jgi:hypothetical protein
MLFGDRTVNVFFSGEAFQVRLSLPAMFPVLIEGRINFNKFVEAVLALESRLAITLSPILSTSYSSLAASWSIHASLSSAKAWHLSVSLPKPSPSSSQTCTSTPWATHLPSPSCSSLVSPLDHQPAHDRPRCIPQGLLRQRAVHISLARPQRREGCVRPHAHVRAHTAPRPSSSWSTRAEGRSTSTACSRTRRLGAGASCARASCTRRATRREMARLLLEGRGRVVASIAQFRPETDFLVRWDLGLTEKRVAWFCLLKLESGEVRLAVGEELRLRYAPGELHKAWEGVSIKFPNSAFH